MKKILLVGEAMLLLISEDYGKIEDVASFKKSVSGAEVNVCVGLTRLGFLTEYVTRLGNDPFGHYINKFLSKENIGLNYLEYDDVNYTGIQVKSKVKDGDPDIFYYRKNSAASKISKENIDKVNLDEIDLIHITGIPLAISKTVRESIFYLIDKAKEHNKFITFDPNLRKQLWSSVDEMKEVINYVSQKSDLVIPGIGECQLLLDENQIENIAKKYLEMGVKKIVIKNGEKGSYYIDKEKTIFEPGFIVDEVVDTVGAGDGFAVGIISSLLDGLDEQSMLERANAIGSIQVRHRSDNEGLPTREQLKEYISNTKKRGV